MIKIVFAGIVVYLLCGVLTCIAFQLRLNSDAKEYYDDDEVEVKLDNSAKSFIIITWIRAYKTIFIDRENLVEKIEFNKKFNQNGFE